MSAEYRRKYYIDNKETFLEKARAYKRIIGFILDSIKTKPCMDCGRSFPPCVMDFDHVRGEKVINLSALVNSASPALILTEVAKCDLVCANCHRIRTASRRDSRSITLEEVLNALAKRKKWYDRKSWLELFDLAGLQLPPLPVPKQKRDRCVRKVGPAGTAWCGTHKAFISISRFERNASRWNGLQRQCMDCRKQMPSRRPKRKKSKLCYAFLT